MVLWRPIRPFRTNIPHKKYPFHCRALECKIRKSRNTWSNRQIWPWSTQWSRAKANRVLPRECNGHRQYPRPVTQEKTLHMDITRHQHGNQIDYILWSQKWRSSVNKTWTWLWLGSWAPYCKNSGLNWRKQGKQAIQSGMTEIESLTITQWKWPLDSRD